MVYLELMRYRNCAMAGIASVIGASVAYGISSGEPAWMALIFIVVFIITGAGNAINDYFDADIDAINRPDRPIPSGRIDGNAAHRFSLILFASGIILSYFIGSSHIPFMIAIFNSILLYFYARSLKRKLFIGNLSVSYLTGSTFLFGGAAYGEKGIEIVTILFLLSMLATLAREIVKTIEDMKGDLKQGANTIPLWIGERRAAYMACAFGILAVLLSPLPYIMKIFNGYFLVIAGIADVTFLYAMFMILRRQPSFSSKYFKAGMFLALIAFIVGSFTNKFLL